MPIKLVGFFREMIPDLPDSLSLRESVREFADYPKEQVVRYLRTAPVATGFSWALTHDILDSNRPIIGRFLLHSDGVWAWLDDLAHYVARYNVVLPTEFLLHLEQVNYQALPDSGNIT